MVTIASPARNDFLEWRHPLDQWKKTIVPRRARGVVSKFERDFPLGISKVFRIAESNGIHSRLFKCANFTDEPEVTSRLLNAVSVRKAARHTEFGSRLSDA
jgi:hypothetical protein